MQTNRPLWLYRDWTASGKGSWAVGLTNSVALYWRPHSGRVKTFSRSWVSEPQASHTSSESCLSGSARSVSEVGVPLWAVEAPISSFLGTGFCIVRWSEPNRTSSFASFSPLRIQRVSSAFTRPARIHACIFRDLLTSLVMKILLLTETQCFEDKIWSVCVCQQVCADSCEHKRREKKKKLRLEASEQQHRRHG